MASRMDSLYIHKNGLLVKMKDLLHANNDYALKKVKKEYDDIIKKINNCNYKEGFGSSKNSLNTFKEKDPHSNYTKVSFKTKIPKSHQKYYDKFRSPVTDYNFLMHKSKVLEELVPISENSTEHFYDTKMTELEEPETMPMEFAPNNESTGTMETYYDDSYDLYN